MDKLTKRYVIGTHVMWFEIEMYKDFIDGMINLLETVETKENVTIDLCLNLSEVLEKIDTDKKKFDPNFHQAMTEVENDQVETGTIVQEIQAGYMLAGRLLRPSLVAVSKKSVKKEAKNEEKDEKKK